MSKIVVNKGNVLPFYRREEDLDHDDPQVPENYVWGLTGFSLPWQIIVPDNNVTNVTSFVRYAEPTLSLPINGYTIQTRALGDGTTAITYFGGGINGITSGEPYRWEITVDGVTYYSEWIVNCVPSERFYMLQMSHGNDLEGVYMQDGYFQRYYFKADRDIYIIDQDIESQENGRNELFINKRIVTERISFRICNVFSAQMYPLTLAACYDSLLLTEMLANAAEPITEYEISFEEAENSRYVDADLSYLGARAWCYPCNEDIYQQGVQSNFNF